MRIAFFGGSFDPPHRGHLRIAHAAAERLHLDRILLAPAALQPLKREGPPPASYADRLAMLRLLLAADAPPRPDMKACGMEVSELDGPRADGQPNYTYDTLTGLRAGLGPADRLFVLLGADSFLGMRHWHRAAELLALAEWIIAARPGFSLSQVDQALPPTVSGCGPGRASEGCIAQELAIAPGLQTMLYLLPDLHEDVSATQIRAAFAEGSERAPVEQQVLAPGVVRYIRERGLYR